MTKKLAIQQSWLELLRKATQNVHFYIIRL